MCEETAAFRTLPWRVIACSQRKLEYRRCCMLPSCEVVDSGQGRGVITHRWTFRALLVQSRRLFRAIGRPGDVFSAPPCAGDARPIREQESAQSLVNFQRVLLQTPALLIPRRRHVFPGNLHCNIRISQAAVYFVDAGMAGIKASLSPECEVGTTHGGCGDNNPMSKFRRKLVFRIRRL